MKVEQLYTDSLAEATYYIVSDGEAVIIDPLRDPKPYLEKLEEDRVNLKYILETHFHADFVSGHIELSVATNAQIVFGPSAEPAYTAHIAKDGEEIQVGKCVIKVIHTPGHTLESSCYLLIDESGRKHSLFTGDTLFIGDVGRPDLAVKSNLTKEDLAGHLFDSLRNKIFPLPDDIIIYPNHGEGSACGKNLSEKKFDTLGNQKLTNYALRQELTKEEFTREVLEGLVAPPQYFPKNAKLNKMGHETVDKAYEQGLEPLSVQQFSKYVDDESVLILDTRSTADFTKGYIKGSLFVGINDKFETWVGTLVADLKRQIAIVADPGTEEEVVGRLARVGYDNVIGYLQGGFDMWEKADKKVSFIKNIDAKQLAALHKTNPTKILDVRKKTEFDNGHVKDAINIPLSELGHNLSTIDKDRLHYVHCGGGYRSVIACSILKKNDYLNVVNVTGGYEAVKETDIPLSE